MRAALLTEYGDVDKLEIRDAHDFARHVPPEDRGQHERELVLQPTAARPVGRGVTLARAAAERSLVIPIARRVPFAQIREAHSIAETGAEGKVVLRMY